MKDFDGREFHYEGEQTIWVGNCPCGSEKPRHHKWCDECAAKKKAARKAMEKERRKNRGPKGDPYAGLPDGTRYWWGV